MTSRSSQYSDEDRITKMGPGGEFDFIRSLLDSSKGLEHKVLLGPGDDAAVLHLDYPLIVTTDLTVEDIHFRRSWVSLEEVGFRAVMTAASDLAAMAANPVGVLVSLAIDSDRIDTELSELGMGISNAILDLKTNLVGGDLTASPGPTIINVTVLGETLNPIRRTGAQVGDELWVTGVLGGSAGAVRAWASGINPSPVLREVFARPIARIREAQWIAEYGDIHAMIDLSDGLVGDAQHLAAASGVLINIEKDLVPVHPDLHDDDAYEIALLGGEDYELCIVSSPGSLVPLVDDFQKHFEISLTHIGNVIEGEGVYVKGLDDLAGAENIYSFDHFISRKSKC